jgi:hypothetical protein
LALIAFGISFGTMAGVVQNYINFKGLGAEMAFTFSSIAIGIILLMSIKK